MTGLTLCGPDVLAWATEGREGPPARSRGLAGPYTSGIQKIWIRSFVAFSSQEKRACEVVDSLRISTTLSSKTKALHHSVTSKMGRKASKMVTHPTPWCLIWFYSSPRILQNLWKGQKQISSSAQMQQTLSALHCIYIAERQNSYCNTKDIRYSHLHEYSATYSDFYCIPCFASYYAFCEQLSLFLLHKRNPLITSTFAPTPLLWLQKCHPFHDGKWTKYLLCNSKSNLHPLHFQKELPPPPTLRHHDQVFVNPSMMDSIIIHITCC